MRRISISELTSLRWSFFQDVVRYASAGFESMGVWRSKINDYDVLEAIDYLHEMEMRVSSVHWAGGFTGNTMSYNDAIDDAVDAIQLTARLNGGSLIVHSGCRNGHTPRHASRLFSSALKTLIPIANDYGVKLAIEPMPCRSAGAWTIFETLPQTLDTLSQHSEENLGLVLDLYHVGFNAELFENLEQVADRIALVQLADRRMVRTSLEQRLPLGTGTLPLDKWFARLQEIQYSGDFEIELHGPGVASLDYWSLLADTTSYLSQFQTELAPSHLPDNSPRLRRSSNQ